MGSGPVRSGSQENYGRLGMGAISVFSAVTSQASSIFQDEVKRVGVFFLVCDALVQAHIYMKILQC